MSDRFARPILCVADVDRALEFYENKLGFTQTMRYVEGDKVLVGEVARGGCQLLLSSQWSERTGKGLMFISLEPGVLAVLRPELENNGVAVTDGWWGYKLMTVTDPDGNELFFPYPNEPTSP